MTPAITITIEGAPGSGKTTLLNLIGICLARAGMNIKCTEQMLSFDGEESYEHYLSEYDRVIPDSPDDRLIHVVARCVHDDNFGMVHSDYPRTTELICDEIKRLINKSREKPADENGEIYREWAYGAFLAWRLIVGDNAKSGDAKLLESIATGEQPF
ncbi:P-loop NTPase family protein [Cellvibrio mixtus]|uniref:hypothetical protein n=1 Tax=Cellvibrio mixtus TaxID=39650 RepID=UPI0005865AAE|nr:hypothetical protein [Cellvibrio mixtus]